MIELKDVKEDDYQFLFDLLKERDHTINISHRKMPTYEEHVKFVEKRPYSVWYIIKENENRLGSIYITKEDEIGIFLKKEYHGKGIGSEALRILLKLNPRGKYLANINPLNDKSHKFFKARGFKPIQITYILEKEMMNE